MHTEIEKYTNQRKEKVKEKISLLLSNRGTSTVAQKAFSFYFGETTQSFQQYYVQTVADRDIYLSSENFFRVFKRQYSLQGIDNSFLDRLEKQKAVILQYLDNNDLSRLYFDFFAVAQLRHGDRVISKDLGSFFAKFVHTFCPDEFCALDNPIKIYFGLDKESFFVAFIIVSQAYKEWVAENRLLMQQIRGVFDENSTAKPHSAKMTNLKLLDLIFWYEANRAARNR